VEQIAVKGSHFQIMEFGMPSFEATFFINSDGTFSVNSVLRAENVKISHWKLRQYTDGRPYLSFVSAGTTFDISEVGHLDIAKNFFQKYLSHLFRN
jgi:hypothetical protein